MHTFKYVSNNISSKLANVVAASHTISLKGKNSKT